MDQYNDLGTAFYQLELSQLGGTFNELELAWLNEPLQGATSGDLNDAWEEFLFLLGFDSKSEWLESLGYFGQINEQFIAYWESKVPTVLSMFILAEHMELEGWTILNHAEHSFTIGDTGAHVARAKMEACDFSEFIGPARNDLRKGLRVQGFCLP